MTANDPLPVIQEGEPESLDGVHTIMIEAWPDLRWIVLSGTPRTLAISTDISTEAVKERITEAFGSAQAQGMSWDDVVERMVQASGIPGMLQEIADLTARIEAIADPT